MPEVALLIAILLRLAFHEWGFAMMEKPDYFHEKYQTGQLHLEGGWYTRGELEALLTYLYHMNQMAESSIKETSKNEQRHR